MYTVLHTLDDVDSMNRTEAGTNFTLFIPCNVVKSVVHVTPVKTGNVRKRNIEARSFIFHIIS